MTQSVEKALEKTYAEATKQAVANLRSFLVKYKAVMSGEIQPPQYYVDTDQVEYWRNGFVNALMRQHAVVDRLQNKLKSTRGKTTKTIIEHLQTEYGHGRLQEIQTIIDGCKAYGLVPSFDMLDTDAIEAAVNDSLMKAPMSQIKVLDQYVTDAKGQHRFVRQYINIQKDNRTRQRLQRQLGISIANGQSQRKLIERIRNVFGTEAANAKRIAQTEGTRVRNQARFQADQEAEEMGIELERIWRCRHNHSRDGHIEVDGKAADENNGWWVNWSSGKQSGVDYMEYPGDPTASAANVCNCHCYVESRVKSNSPALAALRSENDAKREAWNETEGKTNDWRDRWFGNGNHPYARNRQE